jgi:hypothetical protein
MLVGVNIAKGEHAKPSLLLMLGDNVFFDGKMRKSYDPMGGCLLILYPPPFKQPASISIRSSSDSDQARTEFQKDRQWVI